MRCEDDRHDDISEDTSLPYLEARDRDMYCQYSRRMVSCSSDRAVHSWKTDNLKCAGWRPHTYKKQTTKKRRKTHHFYKNKNLKKIWKKRRLYLPHRSTQNSGGILCSVPRKKSFFPLFIWLLLSKEFQEKSKLWIVIWPLSSHAHARVFIFRPHPLHNNPSTAAFRHTHTHTRTPPPPPPRPTHSHILTTHTDNSSWHLT